MCKESDKELCLGFEDIGRNYVAVTVARVCEQPSRCSNIVLIWVIIWKKKIEIHYFVGRRDRTSRITSKAYYTPPKSH